MVAPDPVCQVALHPTGKKLISKKVFNTFKKYLYIFLFFRSNVSTNGNSSTNSSSGSSEQGRFFYSLYDFEATDTTMISTQRGQVVRVVRIFYLFF